MAHLWVREPAGAWAVLPLHPGLWDLAQCPPSCCEDLGRLVSDSPELPRDLVGLFCRANSWILLSSSQARVRINGAQLFSGLRSLRDRDEIRADSTRMFFSSERLAAEEKFPGEDQPLFCPRCKQEVQAGTGAVRCPKCNIWHHQTKELPCWTYSATCALCDQPSAFDLGYSWTPEEL